MAVTITPAVGLANANFVAPTSRYINSPLIYWGQNNVITFETYKRSAPVFSNSDRYMQITPGLQYRPDLIAKKAFGPSMIGYWWKILQANQIFDVLDLKVGVTLRIPGVL